MCSAPKKNWSDWIWSESDLSNPDQIKYIWSAVQIRFKKILNWSVQFRSVRIWSKSDQFKFNPIKTDLIWQFRFKFQIDLFFLPLSISFFNKKNFFFILLPSPLPSKQKNPILFIAWIKEWFSNSAILRILELNCG